MSTDAVAPEFFTMEDAMNKARLSEAYEEPSDLFRFGRIGRYPLLGVGFDALPLGVYITPVSGRIIIDDTPAEFIDGLAQEFAGEYDVDSTRGIDLVRAIAQFTGDRFTHPDSGDYAEYLAGIEGDVYRMSQFIEDGIGVCHQSALLAKRLSDALTEKAMPTLETSLNWLVDTSGHSFVSARFMGGYEMAMDAYDTVNPSDFSDLQTGLSDYRLRTVSN